MEKTLHILLIEDDMNTCNRISNYIATKDLFYGDAPSGDRSMY